MRILLVNKYHYLKGGAERAYFDTAEVLVRNGHDLAFFSMKHQENRKSRWKKYFIDEIDYNDKTINLFNKFRIGFKILYNRQARKNIEKLINDFKPDVVHLHNIYHQLSPSIILALKKHKIPMVMTLHDYKLISPSYNLYVRGQIWEKSKNHKYYRCFTNKCVKNSYIKSLILTIEAYSLKFTEIYFNIDLFISPSKFLKNKFREFGFKKDIIYLPNPLLKDLINNDNKSERTAERYFLYFGRIGEEKGVRELIEAYAKLENKIKLVITGEGPQKEELEKVVNKKGLKNNIIFTGFKKNEALWGIIEKAEFIVVPSQCYENSPYSVLEAMSLQKAVIASDLGGLPEMIDHGKNGLLFKHNDRSKLTEYMELLINNPDIAQAMGEEARKEVKNKHCKKNYYKSLIKIYEFIVAKK